MKLWNGLRGLPREIWILFAATLVNRAGTMVLPFLVLYLTRDHHFSPGRAGFIITIYGMGALVAAPLSGWLSDRYGPVLLMRISLFLSGFILLIFPSAKSFPWIVVATLALALASEIFRPASLAIVSGFVTPEQRKPAFSVSRLAINLGMSIGPALGGFLAKVSFYWLFLIDGITSLAAGVILVSFSFRNPNRNSNAASGVHLRLSPAAIQDKTFLYFIAATVPVLVVFFQHEAAMPLFMVREIGLSEVVYGLMFTVNTLLIVFLEVPLNLATNHWSHARTLALGSLLFGVGFGALLLVNEIWGVTATVVIWTFGEMMLLPGMASYVAHIAPPERQGEYMGLYTMTFSLAFTVGPWAGAQVLEVFGSSVLWISAFLFGVLSAFMMSRLSDSARQ